MEVLLKMIVEAKSTLGLERRFGPGEALNIDKSHNESPDSKSETVDSTLEGPDLCQLGPVTN